MLTRDFNTDRRIEYDTTEHQKPYTFYKRSLLNMYNKRSLLNMYSKRNNFKNFDNDYFATFDKRSSINAANFQVALLDLITSAKENHEN